MINPIWLFVWVPDGNVYTHTRLSPGYSFDKKQPIDPRLDEYIDSFLKIYKLQNPDAAIQTDVSEYSLFDWDANELSAPTLFSQVKPPRIVFAVNASDPSVEAVKLRVYLEALPESRKDLGTWFNEIQWAPKAANANEHLNSNRVFLVHGHDEVILHQAARFLEHIGLKVVILREQPNAGRTIIEKFVQYSEVAYALVLLTADDCCGPVGSDVQSRRARQNVIMELGFFLGKLGRDRVCVLYQDGVEIPSDYSGVVFVSIDSSGAWKYAVAKELNAAGLPIDFSKVVTS